MNIREWILSTSVGQRMDYMHTLIGLMHWSKVLMDMNNLSTTMRKYELVYRHNQLVLEYNRTKFWFMADMKLLEFSDVFERNSNVR